VLDKIKVYWDWIQSLFDIDGDIWMGVFTAIILVRLVYVLKGGPALSTSESAVYASAVGAFAYSNKGKQ
jgi:hypothetical protein